MPAVRQIHNSFNAGEVSPKVEARTDLEKYQNACNTLENYCILPQGGVMGRPGTRYVAAAKNADRRARLIPFEYSVDDAYALEVGHNYIRPYKSGARVSTVPVERVVNGTFESGITGWTDYSGQSYPVVDYVGGLAWWESSNQSILLGYLRVILNPGSIITVGRAGQQIVTVSGKTYTVSVATVGGGSAKVKIGTTLHGAEYLNGTASPTYSATFVASDTVAYIELEWGSSPCYVDTVSVAEDAAQLEITTTYAEAQLPDIKFAQSADVLYKTHPAHLTRKLMRYSEGEWALVDIGFKPPPTSEQDKDVSGGTITLTLDDKTVGTGRTATASSAVFIAGDVGRQIRYRGGVAVITVPFNDTVATIDILYEFEDVAIAAGDWKLSAAPYQYLKVSAVGPVGTTIDVTTTSDAAGLTPIASWRDPDDVGKYIRYGTGFAKIISVTSTSVVKAIVLSLFTFSGETIIPIVPGAWSLETEEWNATDGYPAAVCFYEQRLFLAGTTKKPSTIWGSITGDYENFRTGTADDDGLAYQIASNLVNAIRWMVPAKTLMIGTAGGEFRAQGGADSPLTPSNVDIKSETTHGSNRMVPVRIGNTVLFFQRSGRKLRDFLYSIQTDGFESSDLTILADHITEGGITDMDYEQEPLSQVWCVRADGVLLSVTYVKGQQVIGWSRHITDGEVESVCTIPSPSGTEDQTWVIVKREIDGSTVRYIEYLDWNVCTDSAIVQTYATPTTAITGLDHLEGCTVSVIADGEQVDDALVAGGAITLAVAASTVEVGLPFTAKLVTARPEVASAGGTIQGLKKRWSDCFVRVHETRGITINGQPQLDDEAVTTDVKVVNLGFDRDGRITIEQAAAYRSTILSVFGNLLVGD